MQTEDLFDEVDFSESDMIVLPGGMPGTTNLKEHAGVRKVVKEHTQPENTWARSVLLLRYWQILDY